MRYCMQPACSPVKNDAAAVGNEPPHLQAAFNREHTRGAAHTVEAGDADRGQQPAPVELLLNALACVEGVECDTVCGCDSTLRRRRQKCKLLTALVMIM